MAAYYKTERQCTECGEAFWGTAGANFCSSACRSRQWRAARAQTRSRALGGLCQEIATRAQGGAGYSKLLIRLLRTVAGELRSRGWDPAELLSGAPADPISDSAPELGSIEGASPNRVKWLHSPALEIELLEEAIERRALAGRSTAWYVARHARLLQSLTD